MFIENLSKLRQSIEELLFILYYVFGLVLTYNRGRIGLLIVNFHSCIKYQLKYVYFIYSMVGLVVFYLHTYFFIHV